MKVNSEYRKKWRGIFISSGFLLLFFLGFGWYKTLSNNSTENVVNPANNKGNVTVIFAGQTKQSDKWQTNLKVNNSPVEELFNGETLSCKLDNKSKNNITNWTLRINITQDCYLNDFWCGDFEIHQFRDGKEIVERINNNKLDIASLKVENNNYFNNLMVHLVPGDYLVYYPSKEANEDVIESNSFVGIGYIFYYKDTFELSDFEFVYHNDVKLVDTLYAKLFILFFIIWLIGLAFYHAVLLVNNKYAKKIEGSVKSISIMAEIYTEVHMLNLNYDSGYLIKGDQNNLLFNFSGGNLKLCFAKYIEEDCKEEYKTELSNFLDLASTKELLNNVSSISFEYESKKIGWCSLRLFKMDKQEKINQLIFAVQDINDEKTRKHQELESIKQNEYSQLFRSTFLNTVSYATQGIVGQIVNLNQQLFNIAQSEEEKNLTIGVINSIEHLNLLQKCILDMFDLEAGTYSVKNEEYNLNQMIEKLDEILLPYHMNKNYEYQKAIDANIPEVLEGDKERIMQILMLLLLSSFFITEKGYVKLSIFAKQKEDSEELLFSIRDTGMGFTEDQVKEIYSFLQGSRINSFENPSLVYLKIIDGILKQMNSELKVTSVFGSGTEFYFAIKQKVVNKEL